MFSVYTTHSVFGTWVWTPRPFYWELSAKTSRPRFELDKQKLKKNYCLICNIRGMFNLDFVQVQQFPSLASQQVNKMVDLYNAQYRRSGWLVLSIQPSNIFFDKNISILMTELHTFILNHWSIFLQNWPFLVKTIKNSHWKK